MQLIQNLTVIVASTASLLMSVLAFQSPAKIPTHVERTGEAWKAFETGRYADAIRLADKIIDEFEGAAVKAQKELTQAKTVVPIGKVSEEQKVVVFGLGPIHEFGACLFIKARSLYKLGRVEESKAAFAIAAKFPSARVFDPKTDQFWSPAPIAARCVIDPTFADKAPHEILVADAWDAYNRDDYTVAIKSSSECLTRFLRESESIQADLTKRRESIPEGVVSPEQRVMIFRNGILNDCSTAAFILGRSREKLGDRVGAIKAYGIAARLSHARCWDPQGFFWNPSAASEQRLDLIK